LEEEEDDDFGILNGLMKMTTMIVINLFWFLEEDFEEENPILECQI